MNRLLFPLLLWFFAAIAIAGGLLSDNYLLWWECAATGVAFMFILGGGRAPVVMLWICGMLWLRVAADVLLDDVRDDVLAQSWFGGFGIQAIDYSLAAILAMAVGMRCGIGFGGVTLQEAVPAERELPQQRHLRLHRLMVFYLISWAAMTPLTVIGNSVTGLEQIILTVGYVRYAFCFLIALQIFERNRGYLWLLLMMLLEIAMGLMSFFSNYKEALFIILLAVVISRRRTNAMALIFGGLAAISVIWLSLIWASIKVDYRERVGPRDFAASMGWLYNRVYNEGIDYHKAAQNLLERVGYTSLFAQILARSDGGVVPGLDLYENAIGHVLQPRLLFPGKASLNDSTLTSLLTGLRISEQTSIGVGFVTEAHVDFGFPLMLVPIGLIGAMLGWFAMYFMTRPVPFTVRQGVCIAMLFAQFSFETNINKALGGAIVSFIGLALLLRFGYPFFAPWLSAPRAREPLLGAPIPDAVRP
jgi:hypothetical protein